MGHDHPRAGDAHESERPLQVAAAANLVLALLAAAGGRLSGALSLWSDAGHLLVDVAGVGLVLLAVRYGRRDPDARHTWGLRRLEVLAAAGNALLLLAIAAGLVAGAVHRFRDPRPVDPGLMLLFAGLSCAGNFATGALLWRSRGRIGVNAALTDMIADGLAALGVLAAALLIRATGLGWIDPAASLLIAALIVHGAWRLLLEASHILLEGAPEGLEVEAVRGALAAVEGVLEIHDLHVWTLAPGTPALSAHVRHCAPDPDRLLASLQALLEGRFAIAHHTLQLERDAGCRAVPH